jgi:hypothetical protein
LVSLWETSTCLFAAAKKELIQSVSDQYRLPNLTFNTLRLRIEHIRDHGSTERKKDSSRPSLWTLEHAEIAKYITREFNGEISRTAIWEMVVERLGEDNINGCSQFMVRLLQLLKRRRIRYKPTLNKNQKALRVAYTKHLMNTNFSEEVRTVFIDEKQFEVSLVSVYNLPAEDLTLTKRIRSKSNPVFLMVLVAVMTPRAD